MKRNAVTYLLVAIFVLIAIVLGVANKSRTDQRARKVADSLNRKDPPNGSLTHEVPGAVSTAEPGPYDANKKKPAARVRRPLSIDLEALRTTVLAGNDVGGLAYGNVEPEDAVEIHALLSKIPSTADEKTSRRIKSSLVNLLTRAKGEEGGRLLLAAAMQEGLLPHADWCESVHALGEKQYLPACTYLDGIAFGDGKGDITASTCALIQIDPDSYLQRTALAVTTGEGEKLWDYVAALEKSAVENRIDIAAAVPSLKSRFLATATPWGYRTRIARALESYSRRWNSPGTRDWLIDQLERIVALPQAQSPPAWDLSICRELLGVMRETVKSDPK